MNLAELYEPLAADEANAAVTPPAKAEKVPIVPVPEDAPAFSFRHPEWGRPTASWEYRNADGALLCVDARFEHVKHGRPAKDVLTITYCQIGDRCGWRAKRPLGPLPLYGLDRLAQRPEAPVLVVEGCKSADAAEQLLQSHVAVAWPGGGNAVHLVDFSPLEGRDVVIWPDRDRHCFEDGSEKPYEDQEGTLTGQRLVNRLQGIARTLEVLDLAELSDVKDGWDAADALQEGWSADDTIAFLLKHRRDAAHVQPSVTLPHRFEYQEDGLYYVVNVEEGRRKRIAGAFKVVARTRDLGGNGWGLLLEWRDHDAQNHTWAMPLAMLAGDAAAVREVLLGGGLYVSPDPKARGYLNEFFASVASTGRVRAVYRVGWSGDAFVLPDRTIGDKPADRVIYQGADAGHPYESAGTLQEWQDNVAARAVGNSRLVFAISMALAGPLLSPCGEEGGGAHVKGSSSSGKTTTLIAAGSAWGGSAFMRQWRATANGLEGVAQQHSETILCLDEMGQLDPKEAASIAYMLHNGQGKSRATRSGGARSVATWRTLFLSSGEIGLADLLRESRGNRRGSPAGQEVRVLDIPADAGRGMGLFENIHDSPSPEAFSREIKAAARAYYGTAGPAFVAELLPILGNVGDMVAQTISEFVQTYVTAGSDGQVQRAARRIGLIVAAGELATALGVLPWAPREAFNAGGAIFRSWVASRGGSGSAEERNYLHAAREFFEAHGSSRFAPLAEDGGENRLVINRAGFWRIRQGDGLREFLVFPEVFKSEICRGHDPVAVAKYLVASGIMKADSGGKSTRPIDLPGLGKKRVHVIGPEVFESGE